jgi:putative MFS transporter
MKAISLSLHHPVAFWAGCAAIVVGVLGHLPMYVMASDIECPMADMPMDLSMTIGMVLIPAGLVLATYALVPRLGKLHQSAVAGTAPSFHAADGGP